MPTVFEIVKLWLAENGYDGLCSEECGCKLSDLMPCGLTQAECEAGYKVDVCNDSEGYDFYISPEKENKDQTE